MDAPKLSFEESCTLFGISLADAQRLVRDRLPDYRDLRIGISEDTGDLIITFQTETEDQRHFNRTLKLFKKEFKDYILTPPNTPLERVFFRLMEERKYHVSTAESCTGGLLAARIINVSGSSAIIEEAFITYSEDAKMKILGVDENILKQYGVVSVEFAREMARCLKNLTKCELNVAITGMAGPTGGTEAVPVGTVCIGIAYLDQLLTFQERFSGDRTAVRNKAAAYALARSILLLRNGGEE